MDFQTILVEKKDKVLEITMNQPDKLNPLDLVARVEIREALEQVQDDDSVGAIILTGAGDRAFCAGGDPGTMGGISAVDGRDRLKRLHRMLMTMVNIEKPIIAAINGYAVGAGFSLMLASDIVLASEKAKFSQVFVKVGLVPDTGALYFLPRLVGIHKAKELAFLAEMVDVNEAQRLGLVNRIYPPDTLMEEARAMAQKLAHGPTRAIGMMKSLIMKSIDSDLPSLLEMEAQAQGICFQTEDHIEGITAFKEKRTADFKGK
jgi:2-(1,2-epoxy-1,2-dihydrophenyl)acetyl-CoA isomerase